MAMKPSGARLAALAAVVAALALSALAAGLWLSREDGGGEGSDAVVSFEPEGGGWANVTCEVADTPEERSRGLMGRGPLALDRGMLFDYDPPQQVSFWMKDTLIPLDIVFVNESGFVIGVASAEVEAGGVPDGELARYPSPGPARWVVEVNQGYCAEHGIGPGTKVTILDYSLRHS